MEPGEKAVLYPDFVRGVVGVVERCFRRVRWVGVRAVGKVRRGRRVVVLGREERVLERLGVALGVRNWEWSERERWGRIF